MRKRRKKEKKENSAIGGVRLVKEPKYVRFGKEHHKEGPAIEHGHPIFEYGYLVQEIENALLASSAKYESTREFLIENYGYDKFRELQQQAFENLFAKENTDKE